MFGLSVIVTCMRLDYDNELILMDAVVPYSALTSGSVAQQRHTTLGCDFIQLGILGVGDWWFYKS